MASRSAAGQALWLDVARRGADWLIEVRDAGKSIARLPHDHWLLMALAELYVALPDDPGRDRYLEHASKISETTTPPSIGRCVTRTGRGASTYRPA